MAKPCRDTPLGRVHRVTATKCATTGPAGRRRRFPKASGVSFHPCERGCWPALEHRRMAQVRPGSPLFQRGLWSAFVAGWPSLASSLVSACATQQHGATPARGPGDKRTTTAPGGRRPPGHLDALRCNERGRSWLATRLAGRLAERCFLPGRRSGRTPSRALAGLRRVVSNNTRRPSVH